jgi:hypothetical protein
MGPIAHSNGHDSPGLIDDFVPCLAAVIDDIVVGFEDAIGYPIVAHELPGVFGRIEIPWGVDRWARPIMRRFPASGA